MIEMKKYEIRWSDYLGSLDWNYKDMSATLVNGLFEAQNGKYIWYAFWEAHKEGALKKDKLSCLYIGKADKQTVDKK